MDLATITGQLERLRADALAAVATAADPASLERVHVELLGRKGALTEILRGIGGLRADARPRVGAVANDVRVAVEAAAASLAVGNIQPTRPSATTVTW